MDSASIFDISSVEPEVDLQLPSEMWSNPWVSSEEPEAEILTNALPTASTESVWYSLPDERVADSFNTLPSSCESCGHSFDSLDSIALNSPGVQAPMTRSGFEFRDRKPKTKEASRGLMGQSVEEKELDHKKYKTRLCRNWQQTGDCPYGDTCVYAHGTQEIRGEEDNEAVANSLSKLAGQMAKRMGLSKAPTTAPLRPLRCRKAKTPKTYDEADFFQISAHAQPSVPMYFPAFYGNYPIQL